MALSKSFVTALLAGLLPSINAIQQPPTTHNGSRNPFNDNLASFAGDVMDRWKIAGMSVAVVDGDGVYAQGYGYATLPDTKATPDTLYFAGSTSKAFTAAAVAQIIDSKNHSILADGWSTTISSIIRNDFVMYEDWSTEHITLEDAASHRTGMPRHDAAVFARHDDGSPVTIAQQVQNLRNLKPSAPPRTTWQYCNYMYTVLGHVAEAISGKWLGDVLHDSIWGPLGMTSTFGDTKDAVAAPEHLATGYYWDPKANKFVEMGLESTRETGGAGLVISTVSDYTKWARCLLDQTAPFSKAAHDEIRKPRMLTGENEGGVMGDGDLTYGLGWMKKTYHGEVVWKHGGTMLAYSTQLYLVPRLRYAVAAMANTGLANSAEDEIVWRLIEDKLGVPQEQRYNLTYSFDEFNKETEKALAAAESVYYPDRPEKPIPSSLTNKQIVGHYYDPGYGTLRIIEADVGGKTWLVANRTEPITQYELRFRHVSGNFWLVDAYVTDSNSIAGTFAGEFKVGVDGKAAGLEMQLTPKGQLGEPNVLFKRV
ncbi:Beta-lactamase/transpeptidase-like protein [Cordyceps fumosorosea ARSEF 2679]|uniref:Beta-lactamase/transpeptidase-like protein n=1 Tax=Cordyceps fumosorosea (strain ARSEF 2679) TaxID=1081104 RepID=A0A167MPX8_CORFA|nr:Beta-lactamase/transpeptidase-like protein [Cordyceps fumosorosea ARSEF 2679]OAA54626.1 Beta-lactamase/transpeptidase-like protein [Cordyceps fumosorosea ARSEF 2679]